LAVAKFPSLRSTILVKIDTICHAPRVPGQKLIVPDLGSSRKSLETLGVTEAAGHLILFDQADTRLKFFHSGMAARQ